MHVIGFGHEDERPDAYMQVSFSYGSHSGPHLVHHPEAAAPVYDNRAFMGSAEGFVEFDTGSIMMSSSQVLGGKRRFHAKPEVSSDSGLRDGELGQRFQLSDSDRRKIRLAYQCPYHEPRDPCTDLFDEEEGEGKCAEAIAIFSQGVPDAAHQ